MLEAGGTCEFSAQALRSDRRGAHFSPASARASDPAAPRSGIAHARDDAASPIRIGKTHRLKICATWRGRSEGLPVPGSRHREHHPTRCNQRRGDDWAMTPGGVYRRSYGQPLPVRIAACALRQKLTSARTPAISAGSASRRDGTTYCRSGVMRTAGVRA